MWASKTEAHLLNHFLNESWAVVTDTGENSVSLLLGFSATFSMDGHSVRN